MKNLYFTIGAPGSGKSTFFEKSSQKIYGDNRLLESVISPDKIRSIISTPTDNPDGSKIANTSDEKLVWNFIHDVLDRKANRGELILVDAVHSRSKAIGVYKKYSEMGYRVVGIDFRDTSLEDILKNNKNREPHKIVPTEIIEATYERCKTMEIQTWVELIKPEEFIEHYKQVKMNFDHFDTINFFGDIHGCADELITMLDGCGVDIEHPNKKIANVFVGDYFDRGYDVVRTFKILDEMQKNHWVLFLRGNHEEPLQYYTEFIRDMSYYIQTWIRDTVEKDVAQKEQLFEKSKALVDEIDNSYKSDTLFKKIKQWFNLLKYGEKVDPIMESHNFILGKQITENAEIYIKIPEYEKEALKIMKDFKKSSYKHWDTFIEKLKPYPIAFEELSKMVKKYKVPKELQKDENGFNLIKRTSIGTMKEFALSDIKYTDISSFAKRCAQMFYGDFHKQEILATHGGLVRLPDKLTPTSDMIRGVGGYEDAELCMKTFSKLHPNTIQIHGHRNMSSLPIRVTENTFNINGDIELGLRAVTITKNHVIETTEISPKASTVEYFHRSQIERANRFKAKKLTTEEEEKGLLNLFQDHKYVDVKKLPNNIASVNFTKKAFDNGVWDHITIKARGLFIKIDDLKEEETHVVARGYQKFFNIGERNGFKNRDIRELAYPILAFEKANGFLGLLSVDGDEWFISSKTTTSGPFAETFRKMITPSLNNELKEQLKKDNVTLVFEVIEPEIDPHIEEYYEPELILLDAVKNELNFNRVPYDRLPSYIEKMIPQSINVREKRLVKVCEKFNDYWQLIEKINEHPILSNDGMEGLVFEDSSEEPNMFKLKTDWYLFWKRMRGMQQRIATRILKNGEKTGEYILEKSMRIALKKYLHTAEEFKVFTFMTELAEKDIQRFREMSIIEIRKKFLEQQE